jgi:hypothetical protein
MGYLVDLTPPCGGFTLPDDHSAAQKPSEGGPEPVVYPSFAKSKIQTPSVPASTPRSIPTAITSTPSCATGSPPSSRITIPPSPHDCPTAIKSANHWPKHSLRLRRQFSQAWMDRVVRLNLRLKRRRRISGVWDSCGGRR